MESRNPLPGLAPVAMQEGRHAARNIRKALDGQPYEPFHYVDKGMLATIGRASDIGSNRVRTITDVVRAGD